MTFQSHGYFVPFKIDKGFLGKEDLKRRQYASYLPLEEACPYQNKSLAARSCCFTASLPQLCSKYFAANLPQVNFSYVTLIVHLNLNETFFPMMLWSILISKYVSDRIVIDTILALVCNTSTICKTLCH